MTTPSGYDDRFDGDYIALPTTVCLGAATSVNHRVCRLQQLRSRRQLLPQKPALPDLQTPFASGVDRAAVGRKRCLEFDLTG